MPFHQARRSACTVLLLLAACTQPTTPETQQPHRPQQAGQPMSAVKTAGHIAAARVAALTGNQDAVRHNIEAMSEDMRRSMKLPDAARPINPEAARSTIRGLPGVRSVAWLDRSNLLVRVDRSELRSYQAIDEICYQLEPLGDTLAVVVHVQNAAPRSSEEMDTLSRNCQLAPGDRALLHRDRQVDVLDPAVRDHYRASAERLRRKPLPPKQDAGDRAALEAIPEM